MRGLRYERFLAGTALALVLMAPNAFAAPSTPQAIEAAVPMPEPANVPPPTVRDFAAPAPAEKVKNAAPAVTPAPESTGAPGPAAQADQASPDAAAIKALTGKDLIKAPLATSLAAEDMAVAERLRDFVANKLARYVDRKNERVAVEAFYRDRGFAPLWLTKGMPNARANAAIAYLRGVEADGLDPADYPAPDFAAAANNPDAMAEAEIKLTDSVLTYARHAQTGRVHFSRVSGDIAFNLQYPDPADILAKMAGANNVGETLGSYNPPHDGYKKLRAKLAELRGKNAPESGRKLPEGATLKFSKKNVMEDARVPLLRERLGVAARDDTHYDAKLAEAVTKFQRDVGLNPNGQLDNRTVAALNGPTRDKQIDIVIANMDRWRWLPRDLGKAYVMLNIPDFTLKVVDDGATVWTTRVVTGKPGKMATPLLSETMKFITVNPTWNVPPSIVNNEYLPALQQDPDALERIGLKLVQNRDGTVHIYQPPGERNALGRIRFNFPNKFLVYQHDTPDKHLFAHDKRAYSHGCMRVQNPDKYAEVLLSIANPKEGWTAERIRKMYGNAEQNINFVTPIPVHLTYQTAFVDEAGHLHFRDDVYGRDAATFAALKGDARRVADVATERMHVNEKPQVARLPFGYGSDSGFSNFFQRQRVYQQRDPRFGGRRYTRDDSFFERLFR